MLAVAACAWAAAGAESALDRAAALRAAGRFDDALDVLRAESREIKESDGDDSLLLLPINDVAADILIDTGELETAASLLDKTISAREKLLADGKHEYAAAHGNALLTRARLDSAAKDLPAAVEAARLAILVFDGAPDRDAAAISRAGGLLVKAVDSLDSLLGPDAAATREAREKAGAVFASLGMYQEAIEQRRRMLAALTRSSAPEASIVQDATDRLVRLMMVAGGAAEATGIVEESLASLGPDHPPEATALRRLLGDAQRAADRLVLAEGSFAQALEATLAEPKPPAVTVAVDRLRGLDVALRRGGVSSPPEWFEPAVKGLVRSPPAESAEALTGLLLAGQIHESLSNPQAGRALLDQALAMAKSLRTPDPARVAEISARLAAAQLKTGDVAAARATLERALPAALRDLGPGAAGVGFLRVVLADALQRQGKTDEAVAEAVAALARGLPRPDESWEESATATFDRLAATAGHDDLRERYLAARARQFGLGHPHVASACGLFGAARLAAGDWVAAADLFSRAVAIQRVGLGEDHPDLAANLVLLAHAERACGDPKRAVGTAASGLAAWERAAGRDHPGTLAAADVLVAAKLDSGDTTGVAELLERLCAGNNAEDPARRAAHLVLLADITAPRDKPRARELLGQAMQLACWSDATPGPDRRHRLALTAALAAHAFQVAGDTAAATSALQRARGLALQEADNPKPILDRVEAIAARGNNPTTSP